MAGAAPHPALPLVPPMPSHQQHQQQQQQPPFAPAPPQQQQQQVSPGGVIPQMPPPPGPPMPPFGLPLMQAPGSTGFPTGLPYPGAYALQQQQQQQQLQQHHHILMQYHLQQAAAAQSAMLLSSSSSSSAAGMLPPDPAATAAAAAMLRGVATPNPTMMQSGGGVMPATPPLFPPPPLPQQQQQQPPNAMMASTPASGTSSAAPSATMVLLGGRRSNAGAATTTAVDHHSRGGSAAAGKASSNNGNSNAPGGGDPHFIFDSIPDTRLPAPACPRAGDADTFDRLLKQASDTVDSGSREALCAELRELLAKRYPATLQHLKVLASAAKDVIGLEKQLKRWNTRRIPVPPGVFTPYFLWQRSSSSSETSSPTTSGQPPTTRDCCMKHNGRSKSGTPYDRCRFEDCQYYHGCTFCAAPDHGWYAVGQCAARLRLHDEMQALGLLRDIAAPPVVSTDSGMSSSEAEESGSSSDGAERWYTASLVNTHFIKVAAAIRLLFDLPTARPHVYVNSDSAPMVRAHGSIITAAAVLPTTDVAAASPMNGGISASV